jgi:hypothetical protein
MRLFFQLLSITVLGLSGYYWYAQRQQRIQLTAQLLELQEVLQAENSAAMRRTEGLVKAIEASVVKNQRQPREVAVLQTCQALQERTHLLLDTLRAYREQLLRQSGGQAPSLPTHVGSLVSLAQPVQLSSSSHKTFARNFAAYQASLPTLALDSVRVAAPHLAEQPAIVAGAVLAQTESDLLAAQQRILRYFSRRVGAQRTEKKLVAIATATSNIVHPGETYRARLFLVKQLSWAHNAFAMQWSTGARRLARHWTCAFSGLQPGRPYQLARLHSI